MSVVALKGVDKAFAQGEVVALRGIELEIAERLVVRAAPEHVA